eukprot:TRINITY_DN4133_c0_g1_i1.p1 TRINITY_DN4133_c0_g1~~TRINITY_DN4133_c0_g1_i1.p1  ORF type:complete len:875 (-),score=126.27 TRINITY_DN4133_c0_g1_i1:254-2878(-)
MYHTSVKGSKKRGSDVPIIHGTSKKFRVDWSLFDDLPANNLQDSETTDSVRGCRKDDDVHGTSEKFRVDWSLFDDLQGADPVQGFSFDDVDEGEQDCGVTLGVEEDFQEADDVGECALPEVTVAGPTSQDDLTNAISPESLPFFKKNSSILKGLSKNVQEALNSSDFLTRFFLEKAISNREKKWEKVKLRDFQIYREQAAPYCKCLPENYSWQFSGCVEINHQKEIRFVLDPPSQNQKNRCTREYGADKFLIVEFKKSHYETADQKCLITTFFQAVLDHGIYLCGRHYTFGLLSASQIRENKVTFFSGDAEKLRENLGDFSAITNPAKLASRWGQILSSTYPTGIYLEPEDYEVVDDIYASTGTPYTDGCGEMPLHLARRIAEKLKLNSVPSAFQIRWGGCKGVLVVNPKVNKTLFRASMKKYDIPNPSDFQKEIEVIRYSRAVPGHMNREFIPLFHCLGVPKEAFFKLQDQAFEYVTQLRRYFDVEGNSRFYINTDDMSSSKFELGTKKLLMAGHSTKDPYLAEKLRQQQMLSMRLILTKNRFLAPRSVRVLGVYDFTGKLKDGEIFLQIEGCAMNSVVTSPVAVARNPTVHPGDIRLLNAVDVPELMHLVDVIVFPIQGDGEPIPFLISGGDLDGDEYFVTTHPDFTSIQQVLPMCYHETAKVAPNSLLVLPNSLKERTQHVKKWFVSQMVFGGDQLGEIANGHAILADHPDYGPLHKYCIELAKCHSRRVDAPKTGDTVWINREIKILLQKLGIPSFIAGHPAGEKPRDFNVTREDGEVFDSKGILGELFTRAWNVYLDIEKQEIDMTFKDKDILRPGRSKWMADAGIQYNLYKKKVQAAMRHSEGNSGLRNSMIENINVRHMSFCNSHAE